MAAVQSLSLQITFFWLLLDPINVLQTTFLALTYLFINSRNTEWGIANVMEASGLKEVLELIYAENAVTKMLSGKAYCMYEQ